MIYMLVVYILNDRRGYKCIMLNVLESVKDMKVSKYLLHYLEYVYKKKLFK